MSDGYLLSTEGEHKPHCATCSCHAPDLPEFAADQLVIVSRYNTAHAVDPDADMTVCRSSWYGFKDRPLITWADTKNPEVQGWPSWPCQTCVGNLERRAAS